MNKTPHVMAVASAGGHWVQLMRLRPAWKGLRVTYVTTDPEFYETVRNYAKEDGEPTPGFYTVVEANRWQKLRLIKQLLGLVFIIARQRPDVVLSTGAAPGYFAMRIGRLFGARTVWIDSVANSEELSMSGQRIGRHADLWLTQWEHLAKADGPQYMGSVL
ncbi:UDP-N-acetylglucosamine--LPS N-acetylglucosamine transferase [Roseovarius sp. S1116L3]|uniref:UDP-N-acetylglucosamine--LPS N-acetylglucosamine transferase n=1 Tax=Roseovarius roseus TaxID=3342636 RepID=UPI00372A9AD1